MSHKTSITYRLIGIHKLCLFSAAARNGPKSVCLHCCLSHFYFLIVGWRLNWPFLMSPVSIPGRKLNHSVGRNQYKLFRSRRFDYTCNTTPALQQCARTAEMARKTVNGSITCWGELEFGCLDSESKLINFSRHGE